MRLATVEQSREIDELSQEKFGLPAEILMEAAGTAAAREIEQSFYPEVTRGEVAVVCGPGNNGGDGLVVARMLHSAGHKGVAVFLSAPPNKRSDLFHLQLNRCKAQGLEIFDLINDPQCRELLLLKNLLVDAVFGIGIRSEIQSPFRDIIDLMNQSKGRIVSLDTPSGLDSNRGIVNGVSVKADMTLTFGLAKPGFFVSDGPQLVGRLRILPIGFPLDLVKRVALTHFAFTEKMAKRFIPKRSHASNKTHFGHALVFAGSPGMWGAGVLAASSAYRTGAGYVTLASHSEPLSILLDQPEFLTAKASDDKLWKNPKWTAVAVGPGLGTGEETYQLIKRLLDVGAENVVIDADAITVIAQNGVSRLPAGWVITPHAGELARLIQVPAKVIESDRFRYASEASQKLGCTVLLKGFRTVIASSGKTYVVLAGNSALAKAGTGDVLSGMIVGLMAQGLKGAKAAATASFVHGKMSDEWVKSGNDRRSLQASDLREILPKILAQLAH